MRAWRVREYERRMKFAPAFLLASLAATHAEPLALLPENPHYFLFGGKPAVLVTSGEHYGAVLNADFDYVKYLDTLAADGLNLTRTFTGAYVEPQGAFKIAENTLAPKPGRLLCPWARSGEPGYKNGGNKFDLTKWNDAFFARLRDFVAHAEKRGVVVEMNLFTPMYEQMQWDYSPMSAANNVNGIGKVGKHEVFTLDKEATLLDAQLAMTRKFVTELNSFDNVYYEVCNEPYFGGVTQAWHDRIAETIAATESTLPKKHLISWNVANDHKRVEKPHPAISIFNFHYANPPVAVPENFGLNKVIGLNETGFKGTADDHYRMEAWEFMLSGGGLYNNLDYSFTAGHEDGTFAYPPTQPGGGNPGFRKQIAVLKRFIESFDFAKMKPAREIVKSGPDASARVQVLAEPGKQYAIYIKGAGGKEPSAHKNAVLADIPPGNYRGAWINVRTGVSDEFTAEHSGGDFVLRVESDGDEVAIRMVREP